ncbi:amidohydrolase family protein, partial [Mycobacterium tuberculosis]|nr:amidohydrolase family protein [Mycobacterium tuberculosis]
VFGSDWPVCRVAGGYTRALDAVKTCIAARPEAEQAAILAGSARALYRLDIPELTS